MTRRIITIDIIIIIRLPNEIVSPDGCRDSLRNSIPAIIYKPRVRIPLLLYVDSIAVVPKTSVIVLPTIVKLLK